MNNNYKIDIKGLARILGAGAFIAFILIKLLIG
jgi:hypothetical protein